MANDPAEALAHVVAVLHALTGSDEQAQWASEALENCGKPPSDALPTIVQLVNHPSELVASWACKLVARSGHDARGAETLLIEALAARRKEIVREEAARALGQIGATSNAARQALATAVQQGGPRLQRLAAASLGQRVTTQ